MRSVLFIVMRRKLVKHGPSSLIVSLPADWVKSNGLTPGDEVEVIPDSNSLKIMTTHNKKKEKIVVDITGFDRASLVILLQSLYRQGIAYISLTYSTTDVIHHRTGKMVPITKIIHEMVDRLIGYEVSFESKNKTEISQVSFIDRDELKSMRIRVFTLLRDIVTTLQEGIKNNDIETLQCVEYKHNSLTKLISLLLRAINKNDMSRRRINNAFTHTFALVDKIVDIFKYIARERILNGEKLDDATIRLLPIFEESFLTLVSVARRYDHKHITKISELRDKFKKEFNKCENDIKPHDLRTLTMMQESLELVYDLLEWRMGIFLLGEKK